MPLTNNTDNHCTTRQLRLQFDIEKIIDIADPVYTFCEVMDHIDLSRYFVEKDYKTGRPRFDSVKLLKIILFSFMENGYASVRNIEKLCKTDIRFIWLLDDLEAPSYSTVSNFMNEMLIDSIEDIFNDINSYIFQKENVDLNHVYIDGKRMYNILEKRLMDLFGVGFKDSFGILNKDIEFKKSTNTTSTSSSISVIQQIREGIKNGTIVKEMKPDGSYIWKKVRK